MAKRSKAARGSPPVAPDAAEGSGQGSASRPKISKTAASGSRRPGPGSSLEPLLTRAEILAGILITAAVAYLHWVWSRHAGGLWRDEVVSYYVATKPSLGELWSSLRFDSFPGLLHLVVRGWIGFLNVLGASATDRASLDNAATDLASMDTGGALASTDAGLRVFGVVVGLSILGALWWNARILRMRVPLISLAIFAMSPLTIWTTDSLRSYGLGIFMTLVTFGAMWRMVERPTAPRVALAAAAAILCVHCLYQNAFFLGAICAGGCVVALRQRLWQRAMLVVAIGGAAAASLVPYRGTLREMGELRKLIPRGLSFERIASVLGQAAGSAGGFMVWVWLVLFAGGLAITLLAAARTARAHRRLHGGERAQAARKSGVHDPLATGAAGAPLPADGSKHPDSMLSAEDLTLYAGTILILGSLGYLAFLKILAMPTQSWYYVPPMALAAICLEVIAGSLARHESSIPAGTSISGASIGGAPVPRIVRLCAAVAIAALAAPAVWTGVHARYTNIDLVAEQVEKAAGSDDMIIVYPWYCGATFARYYQGGSFWTTLPPHADLRLQRLDLLRDRMIEADPIGPVLQRAATTLSSGHRIFLVGGLPSAPRGEPPPRLPPAPHPTWGWEDSPYVMTWAMQASHFIQSHAVRAEKLPKVTTDAVNPFEDLEVYVIEGWR